MQEDKEIIIPTNYEELDGSNEVAAIKGEEEQKSLLEQIGDDLLTLNEYNNMNKKESIAENEILITSSSISTATPSSMNDTLNSKSSKDINNGQDEKPIVSAIAEPKNVETKEENTDLVEIPEWDLEPPFDTVDRSEI